MNRKEEQRRCKVTSMFVADTLWKNYTIFMSRSFKYNFSNTRKNNFSNTNFAERENKSTRKLISPKINLVKVHAEKQQQNYVWTKSTKSTERHGSAKFGHISKVTRSVFLWNNIWKLLPQYLLTLFLGGTALNVLHVYLLAWRRKIR